MKGIINVLKPPNMTSHDVVSFVRRNINFKKVGHTGTLDPMAAGVLPICIGKATKIVEKLQSDHKTYRAEITLGTQTDTQDSWGQILEEKEVTCHEDTFRDVLMSYVGEIKQVPPMFSALKVDGRKLVDLAREGISVEREARIRHIYKIDIVSLEKTKAVFEITCSKGTYIRTLCHDVGIELGCGAHMSFLLRVGSGQFNLSQSKTLEEIRIMAAEGTIDQVIQPIEDGLPNYKRINIDAETLKRVRNGVKLNLYRFGVDLEFVEDDEILVFCEGELIGMAIVLDNDGYKCVKMAKAFY